MANCVQCGRELPSISVGELRDRCPACQFQQQQAGQPEPVRRKLTLREQAALWPVTATIVGINLAIYVAFAAGSLILKQGSPMDFDARLLLRWGADYGPYTLDGQWWRLFTSMWLHGGLIHVAANMYGLWGFGGITERIYGRGRYALIYLATGIASSIASVAWHANPTISVGASGAIFGVVGALVWPFYRKRLKLPPPVMNSMFRNIVMVIIVNLIIGASVPVIDNAAHVGGLAAGLILGIIFVQLAVSGADHGSTLWKMAAASAIVLVASFLYARDLRLAETLGMGSLNALEDGNMQKALEKAQRAIALRPNKAISHVAMGEVLLREGKYPEAVKQYQAAHQLSPDDGMIAGRLGHAYARISDWRDAETLLRAAVKGDDNDPDPMIDLAVTLAATNRDEEALQWIHKALQEDPQSARAQFVLGTMLASEGKYREAIQPLQKAAQLDPGNDAYKKALAEVERASGEANTK